MRIAMISTPFVPVPPTGYGGTELVVHELIEGLQERGHEVTLFATGDSRSPGVLRHLYPTAQWPLSRMTDLNHVSWAFSEIRLGGFDVVHAHSAEALACGRLVPELPLVYTLHHVREDALSAYYVHFPDPWYVAISEDQRSREVPLPRIETIHHGLDPSTYECRERSGGYAAFVGRFAPVKGPHVAIDVARRAGCEIRVGGEVHSVDVEFGEREVRPRLAQPHVTFLGPVDRARKAALLRDARALLFPIRWNEPFGLVLIEAMLSGCPPVAFARGSVPELVEEGVTGFVVRDEEAMVRLLSPDSPLDRFDRRRCRERAKERFGRERMAMAHERLYARAVDEALAGAPTGAAGPDSAMAGGPSIVPGGRPAGPPGEPS